MTKSRQIEQIIGDYRAAGQHWPATKREIAEWAIKTKRWQIQQSAILGPRLI